MTIRRIFIIVYASITIISVVLLGYFMSQYFGVYVAVRKFSVTVEKFSVTVHNTTSASTETLLVIQNPSQYTFELVFIMQKLYLNEALFGMRAFDMKVDPVLLGPGSSVTKTIRIEVGSIKVDELTQSEEKDWDTLIHVGVMVPIVGRSTVRLWEKLVPEASSLEAGYASLLCR